MAEVTVAEAFTVARKFEDFKSKLLRGPFGSFTLTEGGHDWRRYSTVTLQTLRALQITLSKYSIVAQKGQLPSPFSNIAEKQNSVIKGLRKRYIDRGPVSLLFIHSFEEQFALLSVTR